MDDDARWIVKRLVPWFRREARDLLWRHDQTPYRVWVSELMLQQTRVDTVTPYFERWMRRFPTVESLACADEAEVFGYWQGLGYYRRARYLHRGAQYIVNDLGGRFPDDVPGLLKIPGVGAYTAGAIASMAFGLDVPAVDGNVTRVLSRFFALRGDDADEMLRQCADAVAVAGHAGIVNQAMMDIGAGCCGKITDCEICPLRERCRALSLGLQQSIPQKAHREPKKISRKAALLLMDTAGRMLVCRRPPDSLLGGLWTLPMIDIDDPADSRSPGWDAWLRNIRMMEGFAQFVPGNTVVRHIFTHIDMHVFVDFAAYCGRFPDFGEICPNAAGYDRIDAIPFESADFHADSAHPFSKLMLKMLAHFRDS